MVKIYILEVFRDLYGVHNTMNVIGFIIGIIMLLGVGIPVATEVITAANLTGISSTIVSFIPVFLAVGALVAAARTGGLGA